MTNTQQLPFAPAFPPKSNAGAMFLQVAGELAALTGYETEQERNAAVEMCRKRAMKARSRCDELGRQVYSAAANVLIDLVKQGWAIDLATGAVVLTRQLNGQFQGDEARDRIRSQLHAERDEQLRQPATFAFLKTMEAKKLFKKQFVSIYSLMRDGRDLAAKLHSVVAAKDAARPELASALIRPYLQFIRREDERCEWTGLRLIDVWRYFRHTWATPYKSIPGRSIMALVRDAAAPCHPVMGIAALSSAAVAMTARDEKIGWTAAGVTKQLLANPTAKWASWLKRIVDDAIDEIYKVDFLEDETFSVRDLKRPSDDVIRRLEGIGEQQRKEHHRFMESGEYKKGESADALDDAYWERQARSALFRSKRALELASLLAVRKTLRLHFGDTPSKNALGHFLDTREGKDAVAKIVRKAKADRVGTAIADLTVCGAVPPYNEILGGKLVAMLLVGPEMVQEYRRRYGGSPSVIASSMAGRALTRSAELVFIGTTSLYGQRPSQYDRIAIPSEGGGRGLRYDYLGRTLGIGTFQFGDQTVSELAVLLAQTNQGQQVNSVFGEGVNPRLRKLRDGLDALGLSTDELLNHGSPRLVYGVELIENTCAFLLGLDKAPKFILGQRHASETTARIAKWWVERWVIPRLKKDATLTHLSSHCTSIHPIRHGAKVQVPEVDVNEFVRPAG